MTSGVEHRAATIENTTRGQQRDRNPEEKHQHVARACAEADTQAMRRTPYMRHPRQGQEESGAASPVPPPRTTLVKPAELS